MTEQQLATADPSQHRRGPAEPVGGKGRLMSTPRVRCAAAGLFHDQHQATGTWWTVTSPTGELYDFCSGACLVEYACLGALPADVRGEPQGDGVGERQRVGSYTVT
jgi:hypothetical protein